MSFMDSIKKLFKTPKQEAKAETELTFTYNEISREENIQNEIEEIRRLLARSYLSENGLNPYEIIFLSHAYKYEVSQTNFPGYWYYKYSFQNPENLLKKLYEKGLITYGGSYNSLNHLKVAELKEVLVSHQLKVSGKKDELIQRIKDNISEDNLNSEISVRYFCITELGEAELKNNSYVLYFDNCYKYGLSVFDMNKMLHENPNKSYRDLIWSKLNNDLMDEMNQLSKTANYNDYFHSYTSTKFEMCNFLLEESRYKEALNIWAEASYLNIAVCALQDYIDRYVIYLDNLDIDISKPSFESIASMHYIISDLIKIQKGLNVSKETLREMILPIFERSRKVAGQSRTLISNDEFILDLIFFEYNDDSSQLESIYSSIETKTIEMINNAKKGKKR